MVSKTTAATAALFSVLATALVISLLLPAASAGATTGDEALPATTTTPRLIDAAAVPAGATLATVESSTERYPVAVTGQAWIVGATDIDGVEVRGENSEWVSLGDFFEADTLPYPFFAPRGFRVRSIGQAETTALYYHAR